MRSEPDRRPPRPALARTFLAAAIVLGGAGRAIGQTPPEASRATIRDATATAIAGRVEREMAAQKIVGLALAIGDDAGVHHVACFGLADREANLRVTPETMFRWASISKPLTAVAAIQLANERRLDLDADVRTLVPEFPEKPFVVTPRHLLCHQGGVVHYTNGQVIRTKRAYDTPHPFEDAIVALDAFKESPLVCEPGTRYSYTTHGYMLLGAAVERADGRPLRDAIGARIIDPLGLDTLQPDYQWVDIPNRSKGYRARADGTIVPSTDTDVSWKLAGGGWISTVEDLAGFGAGLLGDTLLDAESRARMWTAQPTRDASPTTYGLGFAVEASDLGTSISHGGSQEKTRTHLLILPDAGEHGLVVAIMANTEGVRLEPLANEIARLVIERAPAAEP